MIGASFLLIHTSIDGDTFIVLDAFPLPVQGTETRVNAGNEGNEFAVQYMEGSNAVSLLIFRTLLATVDERPYCSYRWDAKRTLSAGIIPIPAMDAGCLASMCLPR